MIIFYVLGRIFSLATALRADSPKEIFVDQITSEKVLMSVQVQAGFLEKGTEQTWSTSVIRGDLVYLFVCLAYGTYAKTGEKQGVLRNLKEKF